MTFRVWLKKNNWRYFYHQQNLTLSLCLSSSLVKPREWWWCGQQRQVHRQLLISSHTVVCTIQAPQCAAFCKSYIGRGSNQVIRARTPGFYLQLCCQLTMWSWASHLTPMGQIQTWASQLVTYILACPAQSVRYNTGLKQPHQPVRAQLSEFGPPCLSFLPVKGVQLCLSTSVLWLNSFTFLKRVDDQC